MRYVVIVAGGAGTRLWPLSRKGTPKQLLHLIGDRSLLRIACDRALGVVPADRILVCTGAAHADQVAAELPELPGENILGEPVGRDSLNAMSWPTALLAERDPDAIVAVLTADHVIRPVEEFRHRLEAGFALAESHPDLLITFGVVPTSPHTGFGYLHRGDSINQDAHLVQEFREKPDLATATQYVDSGEYWWNSGMFVWRASTFLQQLAELVPAGHRVIREIVATPERLTELFEQLPKNSVDYAIMEPVSRGLASARVAALPLAIRWVDIGGYSSLLSELDTDHDGSAEQGRTTTLDGAGNLILNRVEGHLVATVGLEGHVVVHTDEVTLVCPLSQTERIKELVAAAVDEHGEQFA